jgi:hypothetical protein
MSECKKPSFGQRSEEKIECTMYPRFDSINTGQDVSGTALGQALSAGEWSSRVILAVVYDNGSYTVSYCDPGQSPQ